MVGATSDHLSYMLRFFINGCGSEHRALGRGNVHHHLNWTRFRQLAKELVQVWGVLQSERKEDILYLQSLEESYNELRWLTNCPTIVYRLISLAVYFI